MNEIKIVQTQMKTQMDLRGAAMDQYSQEQHMIAQKIKANGAAIAQLTMRQWEDDAKYDQDDHTSLLSEDNVSFQKMSLAKTNTFQSLNLPSNPRVFQSKTRKSNSVNMLCPR
jgi:uncharacterized membrane protein YkoI